jgi:predicted ArsR family transcriptional regulator
MAEPVDLPRLDILKALGDNTRYAIYLELVRSPLPRATAEIADALGLHANTVRPHLERMREVGLLVVSSDARGGVGRPQHRYAVAPDAPSLGLEPPSFPTLARMLLAAAARAGTTDEDAVGAGREQGLADGARFEPSTPCIEALLTELDQLGFDPEVVFDPADTTSVTVAFAHCPFRELAEANPELVCGLHRGLVTGFVEAVDGARVVEFHNLVHREPCQVELATTAGQSR